MGQRISDNFYCKAYLCRVPSKDIYSNTEKKFKSPDQIFAMKTVTEKKIQKTHNKKGPHSKTINAVSWSIFCRGG